MTVFITMKKSIVMQFLFISLSYIFEEATSAIFTSNSDTITLPQGTIKGSYDWFNNQRKFLGIPYASVTDRFQEPGSPPVWNGTLIANRGNVMCNQYAKILETTVGQEDCLVLNVYTPPSLEHEPFPVMVFIHGGGFYSGSNTELIYNPKFLVKEKVIVVTVNYRLGAFGFLCLGLPEAPGNVGLKDQIAALKWVQNNIAYFGGDPNSVTLFGESAGAVSVHLLLLTDSANGLFHRVILQSGSVLMPHNFSYRPIKSASNVASRLGYNTSDPTELLKIFRNSTANDIVKASNADQSNNAFAPYFFTPCVESNLTSQKPLITEQPTQLLHKLGLNVSIIIGFNDREGIYWATHYVSQTLDKLIAIFDSIIPNYLLFEDDNDKTTFIDDVVNFYFRNRTVTDGLIAYFTDCLVAYPLLVSCESFLRIPTRAVYNYYFKYDSFRNLNKFLTRLPTTPGACHGDELLYIFQPVVLSLLPPTSNDAAIINSMTTFWTNFAKTGITTNSMVSWRYSAEQLEFLEIDKEIKMRTLPNEDRMNFWRETFKKYGRK
ncbi:hypothetical protein PYW08_002104 [Mythimna loreyi]|uniref:Uncharacterized protein n=1 Tax=Mythimna loreyi TaxID=667449 RepID=A0ACC2R1F1_9NEOP|nr:hypothetical protein PYW08_002104 [Mythimna loreyi]